MGGCEPFDGFGLDPDTWNPEEHGDAGRPGEVLIAGGIAAWLWRQPAASIVPLDAVCALFHLTPDAARQALLTARSMRPGEPLTALANGVQVWSCQRHAAGDAETTVQQAAAVFRCTAAEIVAAVEGHPWMYLAGDVIEHEGE